MNITQLTAAELSRAVRSGEVNIHDVQSAYSERISALSELNNFISVIHPSGDYACADGKSIKEMPLAGVAVAVKDNIDVAGAKTTCASRACCDAVADVDAEVVKRLKAAGAYIVGKTNMDEFAFGSTNESSAFGAVKNALDGSRVAGGSSGGSANCVAARQACCALGTDTGGSVRQPASLCGVVGLKPSFGAISTKGVIGLAPSLDTIGLFTRDADDALLLFNTLSDGRCETHLDANVKGKTIGVLDLGGAKVEQGVAQEFDRAVAVFESLGAKIVHVNIESSRCALKAYHVLSSAEASRSLAALFKDKKERFAIVGAEVKRRAIMGELVMQGARYDDIYMRAARVRTVIKREFDEVFETADVLVSPTTPTVAVRLGALSDPDAVHGSDVFTSPVNLAGLPAVSMPFGVSDGMPVGIQLIGKMNAEAEILGVGKALMSADVNHIHT